MCLSTAYKLTGGEQYQVGEYISSMDITGDEIILTDIMGSVTRLVGRLKKVDLEKHIILIETDA